MKMRAKDKARSLIVVLLVAGMQALTAPAEKEEYGPFVVLSLTNATVAECIDSMRTETARTDPDGAPVNIVTKFSAAVAGKKISLNLDQVPLERAFEQLCKLAGTKCRIEAVACVIADDLPDHSAFDQEVAKKRNSDTVKRLESIFLVSSWPIEGRTLLDAAAWLTSNSAVMDSQGEGLYFAVADVDGIGSSAVRPLALRNVPLLEVVRYLAYVNEIHVELRDGQVLLRPAKHEPTAGSNKPSVADPRISGGKP